MSFGYRILGFGSGGSGVFGMTATGGTVTTQPTTKTHVFDSDANFIVSALGADGTYGSKVEYLIVAGGGAGGVGHESGGGGGGYRTNGAYDQSVSVATYPVVVGAAGTYSTTGSQPAANGGNSSALSLTAQGGGCGGSWNYTKPGAPGGSGGGGDSQGSGGTGNTPPVSPSQGNNGGYGHQGPALGRAGGGGGASTAGGNAGGTGGAGGAGTSNSISGSAVTYSEGAGGYPGGSPAPSPNTNTGGGWMASNAGSGRVVIRYRIA